MTRIRRDSLPECSLAMPANWTQEALRHRAALLVERGATHMQAALAVGVHRGTVSRLPARRRVRFREGEAWTARRRRDPERFERGVQGWIRDKMPDQMKLPFALWTAQAVRELIHNKLGKTLGLATMPLYLKRWGFTAQKPLTRATPRDPQRIAAWRAQSVDRGAGEAREGGDPLEPRDQRPRPGSDRPGGLHRKARRHS
jgi:transposase